MAVGGAKSGTREQRPLDGAERRRVAATELIESHDAVFRRTARRYSICADDAEDAYQRSLEILLTKAPPLAGDALVRWMQVVTKREAISVRRQRERLLSGNSSPNPDDHRDPLEQVASESAGPNEQVASRERISRAREALRALKPQELRALVLKAQGYSYAEIGEATGWSYTKINRCMAEGRQRFLRIYSEIEQGRRCEELGDALSALADGERAAVGVRELELHLAGCGSCRAKLRAFRAIPDRVLELIPAGAVAHHSIGGRAHGWLGDRVGAAVEKVRESAYSLAGRGAGSEGEATAGLAGGLQASATKALAVCGVAVAGTGGAYCAVNGVSPQDLIPGREEPRPAPVSEPPESAHETTLPDVPQPATPDPAQQQAGDGSAPPEQQTLSPAQQGSRELGIEQVAPAGSSPAGGEFGGPSGGGGSGSSGGGGGGFGIE